MNKRSIGAAVLAVLLLIVAVNALSEKGAPGEVIPEEEPESTIVEEEEEEVEETLETVPTGWRQFYLGFTPTPYDVTAESVETTYTLLLNHSDIVVHHFDSGVPWVEAYEGTPYHEKVLWEVFQRVSHHADEKIYLALTPIHQSRTEMAGYWHTEGNQPRPGEWAAKEFDDPMIIEAYLNFCDYMVDKFNPDYLAYGIEVNMLATANPETFETYLLFLDEVYPALKSKHPDLPVFLTFQAEYYYQNLETQEPAMERLLPYTDYMALSSYPFMAYPDPATIPDDHFQRIRGLAPEKPYCIAETGFPSHNTTIEELYATFPGKPEWQTQYVEYLFNSSESMDAEFIAWFVLIDYDATWEYLKEFIGPIYRLWIETGLIDENLQPKPALKLWDEWLEKGRVDD
ncbi:hypothetical protein JXL21_14690 [Candidatus Bathyarchaeota archaeon]|nr:hypothetical protein [Candidatus Bathyarchaeota archaeon]